MNNIIPQVSSILRLRSPLDQYYPAVYWFWHHIPTRREIAEQLSDIFHAGFRTFMIQPRLAFPRVKYLSEAYLSAYRYAIQTAHHFGLTAGIYDDYNWISGHAGGRTVCAGDELREQHLFWTNIALHNGFGTTTISCIRPLMARGLGEAFLQWCYEGGRIEWGDWRLLCVLAYPANEKIINFEGAWDITAYATISWASEKGCQITIRLPEQINLEGTAFVVARCITSRLINYLNRVACEKFIEVGYEPYRQVVGDYFGTTIRFIFFDHPYAGFYRWNEWSGNVRNSVLFDEVLPAQFQADHSYPFEYALWSLTHPLNDQARRARVDFFSTYGKLTRENFFGTISRWAKQNGLEIAGHELLGYVGGWGWTEGFPDVDVRTNFGADYFEIDRYRTIATVDACNYHPQVSAIIGSSVARANQKKGCIIEQYSVANDSDGPSPVGQWDLTLDTLRLQAIRHILYGARQFLFHAYYQTDGSEEDITPLLNPRFDFPPGINYEPWFKFHSAFAEEIARLSNCLDEAQEIRQIGILYPLTTYLAEGSLHPFSTHSAFWHRWLNEHNQSFDVIDERQMLESNVNNGLLELGDRMYHTLILPAVTVFHSDRLIEKVVQFVKAGGFLVISGPLPEITLNSTATLRVDNVFQQLISMYKNVVYIYDPTDHKSNLTTLEEALNVRSPELFIEILGEHCAHVCTWKGYTQDGFLIVLLNEGDETARVAIKSLTPGLQPVRIWFENGDTTLWGWYINSDMGTSVFTDLPARSLTGFYLLPLSNSPLPCLVYSSSSVVNAQIIDGMLAVDLMLSTAQNVELMVAYSTKPQLSLNPKIIGNVLPQNEWNWQVTLTLVDGMATKVLDQGWIFYPYGRDIKVPIEVNRGWEEQGFDHFAGVGCYENVLHFSDEQLEWQWELDFPNLMTAIEVYLNEEQIGWRGWPPYRVILPQQMIRPGENKLLVKVYSTAGNYYYAGTPYYGGRRVSYGLAAYPILRPFQYLHLTASSGKNTIL